VESRHAVGDVLDGRLSRGFGAGALRGARVLLLCGIGRPEGFRRTAAALGAEVVAVRFYPDHHPFTEAELQEALAAARAAGCAWLVTTEKDAVRLPPRWAGEEALRVVRIDAEVVRGADLLQQALEEVLGRWPLPPGPAGGGRP
jgi:tetraacyldisaccharide 4'-kinase